MTEALAMRPLESEAYCAFGAYILFFSYFAIKKRIKVRNESSKIGETIRRRRELLGLLQPQLASISGISTRTIQLVERGKGNPSLETLIKITDPLGLRISLSLKESGRIDQEK